jgi:hypothetical protein
MKVRLRGIIQRKERPSRRRKKKERKKKGDKETKAKETCKMQKAKWT